MTNPHDDTLLNELIATQNFPLFVREGATRFLFQEYCISDPAQNPLIRHITMTNYLAGLPTKLKQRRRELKKLSPEACQAEADAFNKKERLQLEEALGAAYAEELFWENMIEKAKQMQLKKDIPEEMKDTFGRFQGAMIRLFQQKIRALDIPSLERAVEDFTPLTPEEWRAHQIDEIEKTLYIHAPEAQLLHTFLTSFSEDPE